MNTLNLAPYLHARSTTATNYLLRSRMQRRAIRTKRSEVSTFARYDLYLTLAYVAGAAPRYGDGSVDAADRYYWLLLRAATVESAGQLRVVIRHLQRGHYLRTRVIS